MHTTQTKLAHTHIDTPRDKDGSSWIDSVCAVWRIQYNYFDVVRSSFFQCPFPCIVPGHFRCNFYTKKLATIATHSITAHQKHKIKKFFDAHSHPVNNHDSTGRPTDRNDAHDDSSVMCSCLMSHASCLMPHASCTAHAA